MRRGDWRLGWRHNGNEAVGTGVLASKSRKTTNNGAKVTLARLNVSDGIRQVSMLLSLVGAGFLGALILLFALPLSPRQRSQLGVLRWRRQVGAQLH